MTVSSNLKQLSKDTLLYGVGTALQGLIGFLLFPLYTRMLSKDEFAIQGLVLTATTILSYFLILGLDSGTSRYYYDGDTPEFKKKVLSTWLWFQLAFSIPVCVILIVFAKPICLLIFNHEGLETCFRIAVATLPFSLTARVTNLSLRLNFQSKKFVFLAVLDTSMQAAAAIVLVVILRLGIIGVFMGMLIARSTQVCVGLVLTYKNFRPVFSKSLLRMMLIFSVPLVPGILAQWVLNSSNRYFLTRFTTLNNIAIYEAGSRVNMALTLVTTAFDYAWAPFAYSLLKDIQMAKQTYTKALTYYSLVLFFAGVGLCVFGREAIIVLATSAYETSASLIPWLCFSLIAWGTMSIVSIGFEIAKKSYHFSIAAGLGALATTILNIVLIPKYSITGAAAATMLGSFVTLVYSYFAGQHYLPVRYEGAKVATLICLSTLVMVSSQWVNQLFPVWQAQILLYKVGLVLVWAALLFAFRIVTWDLIKQGWDFAMKRIKGLS